jgi:hypothetical protein
MDILIALLNLGLPILLFIVAVLDELSAAIRSQALAAALQNEQLASVQPSSLGVPNASR